jgi:UDP-N-acetylglucosamine transferase subunit ALG13
MILVTVGSMLPFDRLVRTIDQWGAENRNEELIAQIGNGSFEPSHMRWSRLINRRDFNSLIGRCRLIVGHAGIGTVITAQEAKKPLIVFPRRALLREHNNDHQLHTAHWLDDKPGIFVARTESELLDTLNRLSQEHAEIVTSISDGAPDHFIAQIRAFLTQ